MDRFFRLALVVSFVVVCFPSIIFAHELQSDQKIGVVMHIDPSDKPVVGEEAAIKFSLTRSGEELNYKNCVCSITVLPDQMTVARELNDDELEFHYTFAELKTYTIILSAQPLAAADFQPFHFTFEVAPVEQTNTLQKLFKEFLTVHGLHTIIFGGGFIAVFIAYLRGQNRAGSQAQKML